MAQQPYLSIVSWNINKLNSHPSKRRVVGWSGKKTQLFAACIKHTKNGKIETGSEKKDGKQLKKL